jgi:hypothetical protein
MENELVNKVAQSGIITFNLENYFTPGERVLFDIKDLLFEGLMLKEKDFRAFVKEHDWTQYKDKFIALSCSTDAIVPIWAYMLLTTQLEPYAKKIIFGNLGLLETILYNDALSKVKPEDYRGQRVVIKGCGDIYVPESAYIEITRLLRPVVKSIMYGEPCSTVPLYKGK